MKVEWFTAKGANFSAIQHTLKVSKNGKQKIISLDFRRSTQHREARVQQHTSQLMFAHYSYMEQDRHTS